MADFQKRNDVEGRGHRVIAGATVVWPAPPQPSLQQKLANVTPGVLGGAGACTCLWIQVAGKAGEKRETKAGEHVRFFHSLSQCEGAA
ncbi:MAG TPA: hypothetical protein DCP92_11205 [Nitrospiraceae bacterium]|nr:hypothetical protein [Nitrospiraceae bacterium]